MDEGLEADQRFINDLCSWANIAPSRLAADLGFAATTLTRPASGKAKTRLGRKVLDALRGQYPDFPGFGSDDSLLRSNAVPQNFEGASLVEARPNLPVYGTALGIGRPVDGDAIEQTTLNRAEIIQYAKRPVLLNRQPKAYALFIQGSSMHPALPDGEMVAVTPDAPMGAGDNVVVYLRPVDPNDDDGETARAVLVKELIRRTSGYVVLRQYQPPKDFRIEMEDVVRIDRVLTRKEMLS